MPAVGFDTIFKKTCPTVFVVKNIATNNKRIRIFRWPIKNGCERDLLKIPFVSEADIRHSLLKGELKIKLENDEIIITDSTIDLLQFDECQKAFLRSKGVIHGLEIECDQLACDGYGGELPFVFKQGKQLIGTQDGSNRIFTTPESFIQGNYGNNEFKILIKHNGRDLVETIDYIVSESGGVGSGYNTIIFTSFAPHEDSVIRADYVVLA